MTYEEKEMHLDFLIRETKKDLKKISKKNHELIIDPQKLGQFCEIKQKMQNLLNSFDEERT